MAKTERSCIQRLCCYTTILLILGIAAVLAWYFTFFAKDVNDGVATCGNCHCIPDDGSNSTCPANPPSSEFSTAMIDTWKSQTAINPYTLNCNPFEDGTFCDTEPPLDTELLRLGDTAVCAVHYQEDFSTSENATQACERASYYLKTYASRVAAEAAGGFVTHTGHCGVCSTLQDLAAYAQHLQTTSPGNFCRRHAVQSLENGIACYLSLGMTHDCAAIWADASWNTAKNCFGSCVLDPTLPQFGASDNDDKVDTNDDESNPVDFNSTDPTIASLQSDTPVTSSNWVGTSTNSSSGACEWSDCLKCDRQVSVRFFERYAGRTRRRSGLLSTSTFPCSQLASILQDPCPVTQPLTDS
jgi:hypothetical protein